MVAGLRDAAQAGELAVACDAVLTARLDTLMSQDWVVYSKPVGQRAPSVLRYLARYTHRIAISESRLLGMDRDRVYFGAKDYADGGQRRTLALRGEEFIRRFLLHILPRGFMRVRHYGFLANCHRRRKLALIRECLAEETGLSPTAVTAPPPGFPRRVMGLCPACGRDKLTMARSAVTSLTRQRFTATT
jgi:hypothetical protein